MTVDYINPTNDKTTVKIEHADENWALKLLNESEQEDYAIKVADDQNSQHPHRCELSLVENTLTFQSAEKPSAIENQIRMQAEKQEKINAKKKTENQKTHSPLSRLKSFFIT